MGRQVFTAGEILTAANMNDLGDQTVMVFDDATDRATAIPTPVEGMVTYLKDTDEVDKFDGSDFVPVGIAPAILQVVSTTLPGTFSTNSTTLTPITDLSVAITPSSTDSDILVIVNVANTPNQNDSIMLGLQDGTGASVFSPTSPGSRQPAFQRHDRIGAMLSGNFVFLDSPNTTSSKTYQATIGCRDSATTAFVNRTASDSDNSTFVRAVSTITVMEVAG